MRRRLPISALLVVALAAAGCGSSGSKSSSKASPSAYVNSVCMTVETWLTSIQGQTKQISVAHPTTSAAGKQVLQSFMSSVIDDTSRAVSSLTAAGTPNVTNGKQISTALIGAFTQIEGVLREAQTETSTLPSDPAAFKSSADRLGASVQQSLSGIGSGLNALHSPALESVASKTPSCKKLAS